MKPLKYGSKGDAVAVLQKQLHEQGYKGINDEPLATDGIFGDNTEFAVLAFQRASGLVADGIVGAKTHKALMGEQVDKLLKDADYTAAAKRLGVSELTIRVLGAVESNGDGFLANGKPKILFERHRMYYYLAKKYGDATAQRHMRQSPAIVNKSAGGYKGGSAEYVRLELAKQIDEDCALMSASWGQFQIMGENWQALGYASVQEFVNAQFASESAQLDAFVRFIEWKSGVIGGKKVKLIDALRKGDWHAVFTLYNGAAYKKLGYQGKFQRHYDRLEPIYRAKG